MAALGTSAIVVVGAVLFVAPRTSGQAAAVVYLEGAGDVGRDPFVPGPAQARVEVAQNPRLPGVGSGGIPLVLGTEPGLYGGTGVVGKCDKDLLIEFLERDPDKAAAWAEVQGIAPDEIASYVHGLTPAVLLADTWVTNHGYADGRATPRQSILQAGAAVLVDDRGMPRVKCLCGNPLRGPELTEPGRELELIGEPWDGFDIDAVLAVEPGTPVEELDMVDADSPAGTSRLRPIGTDGDDDRLRSDDGRRVQQLQFLMPPSAVVGEPIRLRGRATSRLPVTYRWAGPCEVVGGELVLTGDGTCVVTASQAGDGTWAPAEEVAVTLLSAPRAQAISFPPLADAPVNLARLPLQAQADSGLRIFYGAVGACHVDGQELVLDREGVCSVTATQPGDGSTWLAAPAVLIRLTVLPPEIATTTTTSPPTTEPEGGPPPRPRPLTTATTTATPPPPPSPPPPAPPPPPPPPPPDSDADDDGFDATSAGGSDCDDRPGAGAGIHPGAAEILGNGVDEDCDGLADDRDVDGDGTPDISDACDDRFDLDGDGIADSCDPDADGDGIARPADCNDRNDLIYPDQFDAPGDGVDQDCDGADAQPPGFAAFAPPGTSTAAP